MRVAFAVCIALLLGLASGCSSRQGPLFAGKLEGGTFWKNPMTAPSNEGHDYGKGSRVEAYDQFIVVTTNDGLGHVYPHGYYSGLVVKRE